MSMGFSQVECREAYFAANKQMGAAIDRLLDN